MSFSIDAIKLSFYFVKKAKKKEEKMRGIDRGA